MASAPEWAMAGLTAVLVGVTWWYAWLTRRLLRIQVEPEVDVEFAYEEQPAAFTITNRGVEAIEDIHIVVESMTLAGDVIVGGGRSGRARPGSPWFIKSISPGMSETRNIRDQARSALVHAADTAKINAAGGLSVHFAADQDFDPAVRVEVDFRRKVDRRRYKKMIAAEVAWTEPTGEPVLYSSALPRFDLPRLNRLEMKASRRAAPPKTPEP